MVKILNVVKVEKRLVYNTCERANLSRNISYDYVFH